MKHIKTTFLEFLKENNNSDIIWTWENDSMGFEPHEIIDADDEPNFYINAKYTNDSKFVIVTYGENVSAHYNNKPYEAILTIVNKSIVDKYVINTSDKNKEGEDVDDFYKYSNLTDEDKKNPIQIALSLFEILGDEYSTAIGTDTKKEARDIAHKYFMKY